VAEEALIVLLTSGGTIRWKRKRDKASRLRPVAEDAASTMQLFNGTGQLLNGSGRARSARTGESVPPTGPATEPATANGSTPLLRYEWRSAAGETLVVEAGWPAPDPPADAEPTVRPSSASSPAVTEAPIVVEHPRLDLRGSANR
jgi:hypothetical protein